MDGDCARNESLSALGEDPELGFTFNWKNFYVAGWDLEDSTPPLATADSVERGVRKSFCFFRIMIICGWMHSISILLRHILCKVVYKLQHYFLFLAGLLQKAPRGTRVLLTLLYMLVTHWQRDPCIDHRVRSHHGQSLTPTSPSRCYHLLPHLALLNMLSVNYWLLPLLQLAKLVLCNFWASLGKLHSYKIHGKMLKIYLFIIK